MRVSILLVLAILAVPLAAAGDDAAKQAEAAKQAAEKLLAQEKQALQELSASHRQVADWARQRGLLRTAYRHYMEAVTLHPEATAARSALGQVKEGDRWVPKRPPSKEDKVRGKEREQLLDAMEKGTVEHRRKGAGTYARLAKAAAAAKLDEKQQREVYGRYLHRVLAYLPDEPAARKALGWAKVEGGHWANARLNSQIGQAKAGDPDAKKTEWEERLQISLNRRRSARLFLAGFQPDPRLAELVRHGETAFAAFHTWFGLGSPVRQEPITLFFFKSDKEFHDCIERMDEGDESRKSWLKKLQFAYIRGTPLVANRFPNDRVDAQRDRVVYLVANHLAHDFCGGTAPPWIAEGVAWSLTMDLLGTKLHWSVTLSRSSEAYGEKRWDDHTRWKDYLRELVLLDDAPRASSVLVTTNFNQIADEKAAYSWSMTDFLLRRHWDKFSAYCKALASGKKPEEALKAAFNWSFDELDAAWRAYVLAYY